MNEIGRTLCSKLKEGHEVSFGSPEEFYYVLGQFLIYVFSQLGGIHKYQKEFNYLTNPYLPRDVRQLGSRVIRFFTRLPVQFLQADSLIAHTCRCLIEKSHYYQTKDIDIPSCTEAFFEGIHCDNMFIGN